MKIQYYFMAILLLVLGGCPSQTQVKPKTYSTMIQNKTQIFGFGTEKPIAYGNAIAALKSATVGMVFDYSPPDIAFLPDKNNPSISENPTESLQVKQKRLENGLFVYHYTEITSNLWILDGKQHNLESRITIENPDLPVSTQVIKDALSKQFGRKKVSGAAYITSLDYELDKKGQIIVKYKVILVE